MNTKPPLIEFPTSTSGLSSVEKQVIEKLIEAAKLIAPIYAQQENRQYDGANFYPHDVSKEEIEHIAKNNSAILDPYTMVLRNDTGSLTPVPYHIYFRDDLVKIATLLKEAAQLSDHKEFAKRLDFQADALLNGEYDQNDIYWLTLPQHVLNIIIGPQERFDDKLFFKKNSYTATVGILDGERTEKAKLLKDVIHSSTRRYLTSPQHAEFLDKVNIRVEDNLVFAGLDARSLFDEADIPNDPVLMEQHGVDIIIFKTALEKNFTDEYYPLAQTIFDPTFFATYDNRNVLFDAIFYNMVIHGITNCLLRYKDAEDRLQELFPIISKLAGYTMGIKNCRPLLLEDVISQEEIESMLLMFITKGYSWWIDYCEQKTVYYHTIAGAIVLNYLIERGALHSRNGISWPNFMKMFVSCEELSEIALRILATGTYQEAEELIKAYGSLTVFSQLKEAFLQK